MSAEVSKYREYPPPARLADRFVCFWTQTVGLTALSHNVIPDGCADIVWIGSAPPIIAGPATLRVVVNLPPGVTLYGLRFTPGWASPTLGCSVAEIQNLSVALSALDTRLAPVLPILNDLFYGNKDERTKIMAAAQILHRFLGDAASLDPVVQFSVSWIMRDASRPLSDLPSRTGYCERQLRRRFIAEVGYGPKTFQRVMRLQRLLSIEDSWNAQHATALGYADQAHMSRDVQALTGEKMSMLRPGSTLEMSEIFKTQRRYDV